MSAPELDHASIGFDRIRPKSGQVRRNRHKSGCFGPVSAKHGPIHLVSVGFAAKISRSIGGDQAVTSFLPIAFARDSDLCQPDRREACGAMRRASKHECEKGKLSLSHTCTHASQAASCDAGAPDERLQVAEHLVDVHASEPADHDWPPRKVTGPCGDTKRHRCAKRRKLDNLASCAAKMLPPHRENHMLRTPALSATSRPQTLNPDKIRISSQVNRRCSLRRMPLAGSWPAPAQLDEPWSSVHLPRVRARSLSPDSASRLHVQRARSECARGMRTRSACASCRDDLPADCFRSPTHGAVLCMAVVEELTR